MNKLLRLCGESIENLAFHVRPCYNKKGKSTPNTIIGVLFLPYSKQFPQFVHHCFFVFDKRMRIAVQRHGRVFVTEDLEKRFHIHIAIKLRRFAAHFDLT